MNGTVDVVFQSNGSGRIIAEDGMRYDFEKSDCPPGLTLRKGMQVEFIASGTDARSITLGNSQPSVNSTGANPKSGDSQNDSNLQRDLPGSGYWLPIFIIGFLVQGFLPDDPPIYSILGAVILNIYCFTKVQLVWEKLGKFGNGLSTGSILARTLIPIYNLYGIPNLYYRWATEFNSVNERRNLAMAKMPIGLSLAAGIGHLLITGLSSNTFLRTLEQTAYRDPDAAEAMFIFIGLMSIAQITLQAAYGHMALKRARMLESISNSGLNPISQP